VIQRNAIKERNITRRKKIEITRENMDHGTDDEQNEDIICVIGVLNGENRNKEDKEIFEELIAENFLGLLKNT